MRLKKKLIIIAPHPDDEVLGVGGTLLKKKMEGFETYCIYLTSLKKTKKTIKQKKIQIEELKNSNKVLLLDKAFHLNFQPTTLDKIDRKKIIEKISKIFNQIKPEEVYLPFLNDIHSIKQFLV